MRILTARGCEISRVEFGTACETSSSKFAPTKKGPESPLHLISVAAKALSKALFKEGYHNPVCVCMCVCVCVPLAPLLLLVCVKK